MCAMEQKTPLERACEKVGGAVKLAQALEVSIQVVTNWKLRDRIPAEMCPRIEGLTGVRCEDLRPDVAWGVLREQSAPAPKEPAAAEQGA